MRSATRAEPARARSALPAPAARRGLPAGSAALVAAALAPALVLAAVALAPAAPWRAPLALAAALWAPGHALVALVYPTARRELDGVERVALSVAVSFALVPVVGLATSRLAGFTGTSVAAAFALVTAALAAAAWRRGARESARPATRGLVPAARAALAAPSLPGPGAAIAIAAGSVALVALLWLGPVGTPGLAPPHLALLDEAGTPHGLPRALAPGESATFVVRAQAGGTDAKGTLAAWLERADGAARHPLADERLALGAGANATRELVVAPEEPGEWRVVATWSADGGREVHAWLAVR